MGNNGSELRDKIESLRQIDDHKNAGHCAAVSCLFNAFRPGNVYDLLDVKNCLAGLVAGGSYLVDNRNFPDFVKTIAAFSMMCGIDPRLFMSGGKIAVHVKPMFELQSELDDW